MTLSYLASAATTPATTTLGIIGIVASLPAWFFFFRAVGRLYSLISAGQPSPHRFTNIPMRMVTLFKEVFFHTEMIRKPAVALAHWFVMMGFLVGSLVWFEAYIQTFAPDSGWPIFGDWKIYHFAEEVLALGTVLGIMFLFALRLHTGWRTRISRFYGSNEKAAFFVEAVVFVEGLGMLLVKASKIATYGESSAWADFFTRYLAQFLPASALLISIFALIKLLSGMIWLFVVAKNLNWGVAWHRFLAFFNIFFRRHPNGQKALGGIMPMYSDGVALTLDNIEEAGEDPSLGVGTLEQAPWKMLLDTTTCTECGRCQDQCPAWHTDKPLSPKLFVTDIRDAAVANASYLTDPETFRADESHADVDVLKLVGESNVITPEVLWSCTNCGACVEQCPVDIEHIDHVVNLRRFQVLAESEFPSELGGLFKNLEAKGNPWGRNKAERKTWVEEARRDGLEVPIFGEDVDSFDDLEYLFWVGCAGAFDEDGKRTTRAVVELLHTAGVKFAVLSTGETCTGDPARRAGNEFLFQELAQQNIDTLNDVFTGVPKGQRKIITTCPHCFNTMRNEYPDFDGKYDVFHHTQVLNRLVRDGHITPIPRTSENRKPITYHDPCFLGRHNKIFDPPRELLESTGVDLIEMPRNRNEGFCCGAGGARMFMEENIGTRINDARATEAVDTGAEEIAVGCPFCNSMLTTGVKTVDTNKNAPSVNDVAVMLRDSILVDEKLPAPRPKTFLETPKREEVKKTSPTPQILVKPSAAVPTPAATPAPKVATPPVPGAAVPPPAVPVSGAAVPTPQVPQPAAPEVPTPPTPAAPAVPAPGAAIPPVATPPAPGAATPPATPAVPVPGAAVPPAPAVPAPGAAVPTPPTTTHAVPQPPVPGGVTPPAPAVPAPGSAVPTPPAAPVVPQPPTPQPPTPTVPVPGGAIPQPPVPPAPGISVPPAPPVVPVQEESEEED